ncbi:MULTISPECIES: PP2C family protein-serine/threonine phosphatase [Paenibacillus]|uniref:Serine/threonine protein phosphatase n=1 Tax=Paenibacillus lautus TaxID=1401 RepID=A0A1R1AWQ5_PAELA|nr:serine/threonine protein phosphatase [Paenibacillus lautus]OME90051.1 serine/threonine protein phosphatase [Paenibacillus lautus]
MRKENSDFKTAFVSEAGSYIDNKDYFAFVELEDMACYVIADGLDTDREAHSAKMAVSVILENFMEKPSLSRRKIRQDLETAHEWLKFESRRVRLKASVLVVVTNYTRMVWATCGHARLYHFRGGRLNLRSKDQSLAQLLLEDGRVSEEGFSGHEERGNLLSYMGRPDRFEPYISNKTPLSDGDVLLLCTPGIWEEVELPEMLDALAESSDPDSLTDTLEDIVLSKQQQTVKNYTAAAVYANKTFTEKPKNRKKWIIRIAILVLTMVIAGGGIWYAKARQAAKLAETVVQMTEFEQEGDEYASASDYPKALKAYSEAKNAASKLKDKLHFQLLRNKQRVAQAMTDGDEYVKDGSFDMALDSYAKALGEAEKYKPFKVEDIQARIERSEAVAKLTEVIKEGDIHFQNQDYTSALETYKKAYRAAIEANYPSGQKQLETKMEETEGKINTIYRETKTLKADNLEKKGDRALAALDYNAAIEAYSLAQEIYQEIDKLERVLAMERKIAKADEKRNPIVPAAGQLDSSSVPDGGMPVSGMSGMNDWNEMNGQNGSSGNNGSNGSNGSGGASEWSGASGSSIDGATRHEGSEDQASGGTSSPDGSTSSGPSSVNQGTTVGSEEAGASPASSTSDRQDRSATPEGGGGS